MTPAREHAPEKPMPDLAPLAPFFDRHDWSPFPFQRETWDAYLEGRSGLLHAPTGAGKTLGVFLGPVLEYLREAHSLAEHGAHTSTGPVKRAHARPLTVLWLTPLRALATDTTESLRDPIETLALPWTVEQRTGDTPASLKAKQRTQLPTVLVTTPESISLLLSYPDAQRHLSTIRCVIVDEWHELLSSKRGTQTELALARLRAWNPGLRTWGLSATLANLDEARDALIPPHATPAPALLISAPLPKATVIETLIPESLAHFPWAGHLGLNLVDPVARAIEHANSTLLFTNTRSQAELWFRALTRARPDWLGRLAIHHGSIDRDVRTRVEEQLRRGELLCVACTSSLDLGVDFSPVDQAIQVGSPKGIARLLQRAGRSGHQPGATSRVLGVPAHAMELVEFAAARRAAAARCVEPRTPLDKPLDVLVQHLVTIAAGGGFEPAALLKEVRSTWAYRDLSSTEFHWCLDFVTRGGATLGAYPEYHKVAPHPETGLHCIADPRIARLHRLAIGTISSDASIIVRFSGGKTLGSIEESFISRLTPGDAFVFAGRNLELVRVRDMTAHVRLARKSSGFVPRWAGGRSPLSTLLASGVRTLLDEARRAEYAEPEMLAVRPLLELQQRVSRLPGPAELLIETTRTRGAHHTFVFPFEGRLAHEGLAALLAHRIAQRRPITIAATVNDYGIELLTPSPLDIDAESWRRLLSTDDLLPDLLACLNTSALARRRFRDIARVAGLIHPGYPGRGHAKSSRQMQASSELFFDVFAEFDPANLLLDQARREVLDTQLEVRRLRASLERVREQTIETLETETVSPLAFPVWAESLRTQHVSSEKLEDRIKRMAEALNRAAAGAAGGTGP